MKTVIKPCNFNLVESLLSTPKLNDSGYPNRQLSNQPFCHSTLSGPTHTHTHRLTDGICDRSTPITLTLYW